MSARTAWRAPALLLLVLIGLLLGAILAAPAHAASTWQDSWNRYEARSSAAPNGALLISRAEYLDVTQQHRAACGHFEANGNYSAPDVPASVRADIARDTAPRYFHAVRYGNLTGNGSPTVTYRSDHAGNYDLFVNGMTVIATRSVTVHRAWVADFRGSGCDHWTEIQTH